MTPCFNSIKKRLNCLATNVPSPSGNPTGGITDPTESFDPNALIRRRRMGITSAGLKVQMEKGWGEPEDKTATDIYNDVIIFLYLKKQKSLNDEMSKMGGMNLYGSKKALELIITQNEDVLKNDLIEFPLNSNEWYRVHEIDNNKTSFKTIYCLPELRSRV